MRSVLFFKFRGDVRQQVADMQVLRADPFAFAAADTVGGPAAALGPVKIYAQNCLQAPAE